MFGISLENHSNHSKSDIFHQNQQFSGITGILTLVSSDGIFKANFDHRSLFGEGGGSSLYPRISVTSMPENPDSNLYIFHQNQICKCLPNFRSEDLWHPPSFFQA